jgi:adenine-specific DNA methylase
MLFDDNTFFQYPFPEPQYLGAKYVLLSWINKFIPKNSKIALDAFAGSQSVAFLLKQLGFKVITNDFLSFNHQAGRALIENNSQRLSQKDIALLFAQNDNTGFNLMQDTFTGVFFEEKEAQFLDNFRSNISKLDNDFKQSMALAVMNRSLQRKITMGHFGHGQALNYANDPERIKRNPNLARPIAAIFADLLPKYNQAIFDNGQNNISYGQNILDLLPQLLKTEAIDFVYFDPPYCDSHADYQGFYHLTETYTEYWQDKAFINSIKRYEPQRFSGFDKKRDIINSLHQLFEMSKDIPNWLISYNDRSYPNIADFSAIIGKYKQVQIETKTYANGRGGKGSVAGSQEILFVCKHKKIFNIQF